MLDGGVTATGDGAVFAPRLDGIEVRPAHRREFRGARPPPGLPGSKQLRSYLTADLLRRYAEGAGLTPAVIDLQSEAEKPSCGPPAAGDIPPAGVRWPGRSTWDSWPGSSLTGIREPVFDVGVDAAGEIPAAARVRPLAGHWIKVAGAASGPAADGERVELGEEPLGVG